MVRKINATIERDPNYGSMRKIDSPIQYDSVGTMRLMTAPLSGPAPEPDIFDTAAIIGLDVIPAIAGSLALSWLGPKGIAAGGAMGSAIGNYWSQQYRINRGFQEDLGYGELAAATAIGAVPLSALPGKGALARTAIRGTEGSALATGELYARTYLDEGRAPTGDEISTTLLFGATFGGVLGAAEAKWLSMKTGVDGLDNKTRPETLKLLENRIDDVGGPANYEAISPTGFFTFRDPDVSAPTARGVNELGRPVNELGPRRLQALDQQALPGPRGLPGPRQAKIEPRKTGSDVIIDIEAMPVKDYAEGVLAGLENKLLLETKEMVRGLAKSDEVAPEFQGLKDAFEKEIASGNPSAYRRIKEIDAEIEGLRTNQQEQARLREEGEPDFSDSSNFLIKELMEERATLEKEIAGGKEILSETNPPVAKGNLADNKRLREIDAEINELARAGHTGSIPPQSGQITKLEKRIEAFEDKLRWASSEVLTAEEITKYHNSIWELITKGELEMAIDMLSSLNNQEVFEGILGNASDYYLGPKYRSGKVFDELMAVGVKKLKTPLVGYKAMVEDAELETLVRADPHPTQLFAGIFLSLRSAKEDLARMGTQRGATKTHTAAQKAKITKLEKERDRLHVKHGITQVRGGAAGLAAGAGILTQAEEDELRDLGPWAMGMGLMAGAMLPPGAGGFFRRAINRMKRGARQASDEVAKATKSGKPAPPVEPTAPKASQVRHKQSTPRDKQDIRSYYFDELIEFIEDGSNPTLVEQAITELSRRATRDSATALRLQRKLEELAQRGKAPKQTKATVSEEGAGRLAPAADPATRQAVAEGIEQGTIAQPRGPVANWSNKSTDELLQAIQRGDAESEFASTEALRRAMNKPKTRRFFERHAPHIFPAILAGGVSVGAVADILEEDDGEFKKAGMGGVMLLLLAAALGKRGYTKFMKTKQGRQAKIAAQLNPSKVEPDTIKAKVIDDVGEKAKDLYVSPSELKKTWQGVKDMANFLLVPLSRNLKKISETLAAQFRRHDLTIRTRTREYLDRAAPFITEMTKRLKKNPLKFQEFKLHLLNGDFPKLAIMLDKIEASQSLRDSLTETRKTLDEIRIYAREEGGIDVGYFENYFPRQVKDYATFKKYLDDTLDNRDLRNDIDKALDEYAQKWKLPSRDLIPPEEAAEVTSRVLRGYPMQPGASLPENFKQRSIGNVTPEMLDAYADPANALRTYIERAVDSTERRKFLYKKPTTATKQVGFEGSADRVGSDLGMRMDVDESLAATVARRLGDENKLSPEDVTKLAEIIQSRFSGKTVDSWVQGLKNANYIQVMGNFGSAITQLAEISYAAFFHGFDNTFQALFNRKDNFNFTKHFGLSDHHIDAQTSAGGLAKALDWVFTKVGLKKFDQLSKNTIMNASWKKYRAEALRKGGAADLMDELSPIFGPDRSREMIDALQQSKPNSKNLPEAAEELIWYKFLDLNPATLTEMPTGYTESGNARILYMLKTFTIKQFDVYREAAGKDVARATSLYQKGDKKAAAKAAGEAVAKFAGLATLFAAANASTDVVKDTLYGRPTKPDDLVLNNVLRLAGINRYLTYKAQREGVAKSIFELALPPTAVFDRAYKDISDIVGDGKYRGNMLQGTPLDLIYWRALGGLDKIENMK